MTEFVLEKPLATSLAQALLRCVTIHNRKEDWDRRDIPYRLHPYQSVCISLWKLGLAQIRDGLLGPLTVFDPGADDHEMSQWLFRISHNGRYKIEFIPETEIETKIDFSHWGDAINLKILLQQFILCMVKFGLAEKLPASRKSVFDVKDPTLKIAVNQLAENGYAVRAGKGFQWTDKVAVYMLENYLWTQDEIIESRTEHNLISKSFNSLTRNALKKIPHYSTSNISNSTAFGASIVLLRHWDGAVWHDHALDAPKISFETAVGIATRFIEKFKPTYENGKNGWALKTPKYLSEDEKRLVTSLVKVIHIWWELSSLDEQNNEEKYYLEPPGYVHHHHESTFETSGEILWRLGLANAGWHTHNLFDISYDQYQAKYANPQDLSFPVVFKPIPKRQIDEKILFHNFYPALSIFQIMTSFLDLASDYGGKLSVKRQSEFSAPNSELAKALDVLVGFGYAQKSGADYIWTDKISVPMISGYYWTEDDFDFQLVAHALADEVFSVLEKMDKKLIPRGVWDGYLGRNTDSVMGFVFGLLRHWSDGRWSKELNTHPSMTMDTAIVVAREFLGKYKHNDDYINHDWIAV